MSDSEEASGKDESGISQPERLGLLKIVDRYLEHRAFQENNDLQAGYLRKGRENLEEGKPSLSLADVKRLHKTLHESTKEPTSENIHTEVSKLRKRIKAVAQELGLPEITLTPKAGVKGTYAIGLAPLPPPVANVTAEPDVVSVSTVPAVANVREVLLIAGPSWSRPVIAVVAPLLVVLSVITILAMIEIGSRYGQARAGILNAALTPILVCLVFTAIPVLGLLKHKVRALWPTSLSLKLDDLGLRVEQIWLDCPECAPVGKTARMVPAWDRSGRRWILQCQNDPEHRAVFHPMTYRVERLTG